MPSETPRSRAARQAAELALVRVVHHYGQRPEFVVLGGLVPEILCSGSQRQHAGTTDVDVQVNLEIGYGSVNAKRLEDALKNAEFVPDGERAWRWIAEGKPKTLVKFELLADLDSERSGDTIHFKECHDLGAVNLRGTGFASRDTRIQEMRGKIGGTLYKVEVKITGLAGFLLAKTAAAFSRRKTKDWYDVAFVLLHNNEGGVPAAIKAVLDKFAGDLAGLKTALDDLRANFATETAQGPRAYAEQMVIDHPDQDPKQLAADAMLAVTEFYRGLFS